MLCRSPDTPIPCDIYWLYILQVGFYVHETYAMINGWESRRKDDKLMISHHGCALMLLTLSYANRCICRVLLHSCHYHRHHIEGLLVLFCHDLNDVFLEQWKLNNTLTKRANGKFYALHDNLAKVCFGIFFSTWLQLDLKCYCN